MVMTQVHNATSSETLAQMSFVLALFPLKLGTALSVLVADELACSSAFGRFLKGYLAFMGVSSEEVDVPNPLQKTRRN